MTKISVIVPTFNRAQTLARALNSLRVQSLPPFEIIVIDDGSTDTTKELVDEWTKAFKGELIYHRTINRGVSAARNLGAQLARGEWLAFLDSDDEWLPRKLELQSQLMDRFPLIHGEEIWIRNGTRVNQMKKHKKSGGRIFSRCVDLCCVSPSSSLIEKELFLKLNGFREDFPVCEDYELWLRISARHQVGFIEQPVVIKYGGHEDQLSRRYRAMDFYRARALVQFLESLDITEVERQHVIQTLIKKCGILIQGYRKHHNLTDLATVQGWLARALNAQSAIQMAHSVTERFPRSELSGSL